MRDCYVDWVGSVGCSRARAVKRTVERLSVYRVRTELEVEKLSGYSE